MQEELFITYLYCIKICFKSFKKCFLLGPPLIGMLRDYYGAFSYPLYYAAAGFGIGFVFNGLSECFRSKGIVTKC